MKHRGDRKSAARSRKAPPEDPIIEILERDEIRGVVGLAHDLKLSRAELMERLAGLDRVEVRHQRRGCALVRLRSTD